MAATQKHGELRYKELFVFFILQELYEALTDEKSIAAEIQGSRAANRNISSRLKKLDLQSIKQQEIIYNQVCL